jgi:hypothetical protein
MVGKKTKEASNLYDRFASDGRDSGGRYRRISRQSGVRACLDFG